MAFPEGYVRYFPPPRDRLMARVRVVGECWEWQGALNKTGYGRLCVGPKQVLAHRGSWLIHHGPIPAGLYVCHRCDNPPCVNPAHLFLGTAADNNRDMYIKGRMAHGVRSPHAKLTEDNVETIRRLVGAGMPQKTVAQLFRIADSMVSTIWTRKRWAHVQ